MTQNLTASFRDPSGYIYIENNDIYRRINKVYFKKYELLMSGLYDHLTTKKWLISHKEIEHNDNFIIIKPTQLDFVSYPFEWSFSQLKDAAILTLTIHKAALEHNMMLKDATAYNIQFLNHKPVFIDTLSFDFYEEKSPWVAYGQFCRHFLAPLILMKQIGPDLNKILTCYLDGIPLDIVSGILPFTTRFHPVIGPNIHMHAKAIAKHKDAFGKGEKAKVSKKSLLNIAQNLIEYISGLSLTNKTEWGEYYDQINYPDQAFKEKEKVVYNMISRIVPETVWDIGGNDGHFTRIIKDICPFILCSDIDPMAVDVNYRQIKERKERNIYPFIADITNPSPGIGFSNKERLSLFKRIQNLSVDCVLALALIHHIAISNNCSFDMIAKLFAKIANYLIIEFVDRDDSWAKKLLNNKRKSKHLFNYYNKNNFEKTFNRYFSVIEKTDIKGTNRSVYLMERRNDI